MSGDVVAPSLGGTSLKTSVIATEVFSYSRDQA